MATFYRPNRHMAPSLRGLRSIDAEEQRMRDQIRRENAEAAVRKAALSQSQRKSTNLGDVKSSQQNPYKY